MPTPGFEPGTARWAARGGYQLGWPDLVGWPCWRSKGSAAPRIPGQDEVRQIDTNLNFSFIYKGQIEGVRKHYNIKAKSIGGAGVPSQNL